MKHNLENIPKKEGLRSHYNERQLIDAIESHLNRFKEELPNAIYQALELEMIVFKAKHPQRKLTFDEAHAMVQRVIRKEILAEEEMKSGET